MERDAWPLRRVAAEARRVLLEMGSARLTGRCDAGSLPATGLADVERRRVIRLVCENQSERAGISIFCLPTVRAHDINDWSPP
jgi:hypothetical protein